MEPELPEGTSGNLRLRRLTFRYPIRGSDLCLQQQAQFLEEWRDGAWLVWMSDTLDEVLMHEAPLLEARGQVLVAGLGLGFFAYHAARRPEVAHVDVVEINADVIALVWPHLPHRRLSLVHGDIADYLARPPHKSYDFAYIDIWPTIVAENLPAMRRLKDLARRWLAPAGRVVCWGESVLVAEGQRDDPGPPAQEPLGPA